MSFVGDHSVKADAKGRVAIPSAFRKQLGEAEVHRFVIRRDIFQNCLVLYPLKEWERQVKVLRSKLNDYNRSHKRFKAQFFRDTAEVEMDGSGRILFPRRLFELVEIERELVLAGLDQVVEVWAKEAYEKNGMESDDFADLAEDILGGLDFSEEDVD